MILVSTSTSKPARPSQVTLAGWMVIAGSVVIVLTVFDQIGTLHTLAVRQQVEKFLSEPPADGLGLSVDSAVRLLRVASMVAAGCAAAAAILGWHVLHRHRGARIALTVVAVPLFLTGVVAGPFFSSVVAVSALMLWSRPARDWFDGITRPEPRIVHPSGASAPSARIDAPIAPAGYPGFGSVRPGPQPDRRRPDQVLWACVLTWVLASLSTLVMIGSAVVLATDSSGLLDEVRRQNPDLESAGLTEQDIVIGVSLVLAVCAAWAIASMVLAWFVWRGRDWARIVLIVSAGLTAGLALLASLATFFALPLLIGSGVAMRLLLGKASSRWCREASHR